MEIRNTTTLNDLFSESPELEEFVANLVQDYSKVEQPELKESIRNILTVERVALLGELDVNELIRQLNEKIGAVSKENSEEIKFVPDDPEWVRGTPVEVVDGVDMLNRGLHPVGTLTEIMEKAMPGNFVLLTTNFLPKPLIDAMEQLGHEVYSRKDVTREELFLTFVLKK